MSREITTYNVNTAIQLKLEVLDEPGADGANHLYNITGFNSASNASNPWVTRPGQPEESLTILFQNGPVLEKGANGITQEVLLAVLIDRLCSFQAGPSACRDSAIALFHVEEALTWLQRRAAEHIQHDVMI